MAGDDDEGSSSSPPAAPSVAVEEAAAAIVRGRASVARRAFLLMMVLNVAVHQIKFSSVMGAADDPAGESEWKADGRALFAPFLHDVGYSPTRLAREASDDFDNETSETTKEEGGSARILTIRLTYVSNDIAYTKDGGSIEVLRNEDIPLKLYGYGLTKRAKVKLTTNKGSLGGPCQGDNSAQGGEVGLDSVAEDGTWAKLTIKGKDVHTLKEKTMQYFCLSADEGEPFLHQGTETEASFDVTEHLLPIWLMIIFVVILLSLSGLFSGLNLGLMALDQTELKIVQNTGNKSEKSYANKIAPIRSHGNFLLCSLLLGNVLVNNTLTILLDILTGGGGVVAIIASTLGIVIFGEIIPQAICSRHGLAVGAYTIWLTKFFMLLTFPLSFPISKLLDRVLGAEIGTVYNKQKLIELLRVTDANNDLEKEEVDIVTGALVYKDKRVKDIMTKVEDVYMLPLDTVLDFETVSEIREQGYSRIPVYSNDRKNIVHILFAKDLMFIDPDDKMPLNSVCEFYNNEVNFVFHDTPLNVMFNEFKSGDKGHMAFVQEINTEGEGDPFYETIGLVTLEDIIEEIIQQEIVDETDIIADNRTKRKLKREGRKGKEGLMLNPPEEKVRKVNVSPQLALAVFQYLTTSIEPFKAPLMNDSVLKKLLALDVFRDVKLKKDKTKMNEEDLVIMKKGSAVDCFVLIIEGRVEVNIGREELVFESGPFTYFGIQVLNNIMENPSLTGGLSLPTNKPLAALASSQSHSDAVGGGGGGGMRSNSNLRKTSTQLEAPSTAGGKRNGDAVMSRQGSGYLHPATAAFVPDYTVKAVTDVLYLRIKKGTYAAALKASQMQRKQNFPNEMGADIDRYLEKVNENEGDLVDILPVMMRSPSLRSPEKDGGGGVVAAMAAMSAAAAGIGSPRASVGSTSPVGSPRAVHRIDSFKRVAAVGGSGVSGDGGCDDPTKEESKAKRKREPEFWGEDEGDGSGGEKDSPVVITDLTSKGGGGGDGGGSVENGPSSIPGGPAKKEEGGEATVTPPRTAAAAAPLDLDESGDFPSPEKGTSTSGEHAVKN